MNDGQAAEEEEERQTESVLVTNRKKAVIAINCSAIALFVYTALMKHAVNEKGVNALDVCFVRTLFIVVLSGLLAKVCLGVPFYVAE